jgi:hypothetical protein
MGVCDVCDKGRGWGVCQLPTCKAKANAHAGKATMQAPQKDDPLPPHPPRVSMGCIAQFFLSKRGDI